MSRPQVFINTAKSLCAVDIEKLLSEANHQGSAEFHYINQFSDKKNGDNEQLSIIQKISLVLDSAIDELALDADELKRTHLFLGSTSMDISETRPQTDSPIWLTKLDSINQQLVAKYGLNSLHFTFNTACTSSANALIYASRLIRAGEIERAIVVGCEFYNQLTIEGFGSLELLSEKGLLAFSEKRDGMVLGEGIGVLVVSAHSTGSEKLAVLDGYSSCDTYSLTTTQEDGSHIQLVIEKAVELAKLKVSEIDLIKIHGTASPASDLAESNAIKHFFSKQGSKIPPVFALKPFTGHTLGACGVLEIALLDQLLRKNKLPTPSYIYEQKTLIPFVKENDSIANCENLLLNHCGFGGNNAAILVHQLKPESALNGSSETIQHQSPIDSSPKENPLAKPCTQVIDQIKVEYPLTMEQKSIRKKVKALTGFDVRRMDSFSLMGLQALFLLLEEKNLNGKVGLYGVADYFSIELLQSLLIDIEAGEDIRPFDFISTVGNAANFNIAKMFNITGPNVFLGDSRDDIISARVLAQSDLTEEIIDFALLIHWQVHGKSRICSAQVLQHIAV